MCNTMKYSRLVSMNTPNSLVPWLEEELEQRGIDAVYTRYILSFLLDNNKEPEDCDHVKANQYLYQEYGKHGHTKPVNYKTYEEPCSCTSQISKKAYIIELLKAASEPFSNTCGLEELTEKICQKISELKQLNYFYTPNKDSSGESSGSDCSPPPSPQEESQKYLEAFPSLSEKHIDFQPLGNNPTWVKSVSEKDQFKMFLMNAPKFEQHSFIVPKIPSQTIKFDTKSKPFINPQMLQQSTKGKNAPPNNNLLPTIEFLNSSMATNSNGLQPIHAMAPEMTLTKQKSNNLGTQETSSHDFEKFQNKFNDHIASIWGDDQYSKPNGNSHIWKYEPVQETFNNAFISESSYYSSDIQNPILESVNKRGYESHSNQSFITDFEKTCSGKMYNNSPPSYDLGQKKSLIISKMNQQPFKPSSSAFNFSPLSQKLAESNDASKLAFYKRTPKDEEISSIWKPTGVSQSVTPTKKPYGIFSNGSNNEPPMKFHSSFVNSSENENGMNLSENLGNDGFSRPNSCPIPKMGIPFLKPGSCHSAPNSYRETINESFGESLSKQDGFYQDSFFEKFSSVNMKSDKFFKTFSDKSVGEENNLDIEGAKGDFLRSSKPLETFQKQQNNYTGMCKKPCTYYMEGECFKTDCKFSHDLSSITCKFWENKSCFKGELCPFLHGYTRKVVKTPQAIKPKFAIESELDFPSLSTVPSKPKPLEAETKIISKKKKGKSFGNVP